MRPQTPAPFRRFINSLLYPKIAVTKHLTARGTRESLQSFAFVAVFVLLNVVFLVQQEVGYGRGVRPAVASSYGFLIQFIILIHSFLIGYLGALITLSSTYGLAQAIRSLLYAGGNFLILNISAYAAMPQKYTLVLNKILGNSIRALTGINDPYFWEYTNSGTVRGVDLFVAGRTENFVYSQPPLFEILTTPVPLVLFTVWVGSFGYFLYSLYLDARINHNISVVETILALVITVWFHTIILTSNNPLEPFLRVGPATRIQTPAIELLRWVIT